MPNKKLQSIELAVKRKQEYINNIEDKINEKMGIKKTREVDKDELFKKKLELEKKELERKEELKKIESEKQILVVEQTKEEQLDEAKKRFLERKRMREENK